MEEKVKTLVIKPVVKSKFSGQSSYSGTHTVYEGAQLGKGGYKTGLTREEEIKFAEELNLPKGTLSRQNKDFWGSMLHLNLPNDKPYYFTVDSLIDELRLRVIKNHSAIAPNELELAKNPNAEFYIEDAEAKAKGEEIVINFKMEAGEKFSSLSVVEKKGILKLYGKKGVDDMSETVIKTQLFKEVETNPKKFLELCNNPDIELMIEIQDMLETGVLVKKGQFYTFENETIGNSVEAVITFFKDMKNQSIKIAAKQATKKKD
jgi:hypothetical protein